VITAHSYMVPGKSFAKIPGSIERIFGDPFFVANFNPFSLNRALSVESKVSFLGIVLGIKERVGLQVFIAHETSTQRLKKYSIAESSPKRFVWLCLNLAKSLLAIYRNKNVS